MLAAVHIENICSHQKIRIYLAHKTRPKNHSMDQWKLQIPQTLSRPRAVTHTGNKEKRESVSHNTQQSSIREDGHHQTRLSLACQMSMELVMQRQNYTEKPTMPNASDLQFWDQTREFHPGLIEFY